MTASIWHGLGTQFSHPSGLAGAALGKVMRLVNAGPNRAAIAALGVQRGDQVLELGCGPGEALLALSRLASGGTVHGVDRSAVMLRQAARRNARAIGQMRVSLHSASFEALPVADASIDKVLAVNVIYFWTDLDAILRELRRILRPGGRFVVYATDAASMRNWRFARPDTHRLFDATALRDSLRSGPFQDADVSIRRIALGFGVAGLVAVVEA
ncbi:MAG: methyltransferase domain-containing protein [Alphaproteobacteria bacterium]|nr:methyltransferase domain-containing protein [Alphaproteobacteria bacterium]